MRNIILGVSALALASVAAPVVAQDQGTSEPFTISGNVALVSDYRFRGFTQSNENAAVQGGITVSHESGLYAGTWASSISFAGNTEVDLFAGYSTDIAPGINVDAGLLYYLYPKHGGGNTDFFEPYLNLTGTYGPASLKVGVNYAWKQSALTSLENGSKVSAVYLHAEPSINVPNTPISLNGHVGYADSKSFLGGYGVDHHVWDYSVGATTTYKMLTLGVSYVTTDEHRVRTTGFGAGLGAEAIGADGAVVFSLSADF